MRISSVCGIMRWFLLLPVFAICSGLPVSAQRGNRLKYDLQGDYHWSKYNYTDLTYPYEDWDGWIEYKVALFDKTQSYGPFVAVTGSWCTDNGDDPYPRFWWQRYGMATTGVQWHPFSDADWLKAVRLFCTYSWREYSDEGSNPNIDWDYTWGADYYRDNIYGQSRWIYSIYATSAFHRTNFASNDYRAWVSAMNLKVGPGWKKLIGKTIINPYVLADLCWAPQHDDRFWENYLRAGVGIRIYPVGYDFKRGGIVGEFSRRFHFYAEAVNNVTWLEKEPIADLVKWDYRFGIAFSTGGYYRGSPTSN